MEVKQAIDRAGERGGAWRSKQSGESFKKDSPQMQADLEEKLEKYNMEKKVVRPKSEATIKSSEAAPDDGHRYVEITIPMEEYKDPER